MDVIGQLLLRDSARQQAGRQDGELRKSFARSTLTNRRCSNRGKVLKPLQELSNVVHFDRMIEIRHNYGYALPRHFRHSLETEWQLHEQK